MLPHKQEKREATTTLPTPVLGEWTQATRTPDSAAHVKPDTLPTRPVRGRPRKADRDSDRATGTDAVRYASVNAAT